MHTIPSHESLTVEFKSDLQRLGDNGLVAAVVAMANTEGEAQGSARQLRRKKTTTGRSLAKAT